MIHTIQVVFPIDATDVQFITRKIGLDYTVNQHIIPAPVYQNKPV